VLEGFCFLGGPPETSPRPLSNAPIFVAIGVVTASEEDPERDAGGSFVATTFRSLPLIHSGPP
jgi:hypothetical protein